MIKLQASINNVLKKWSCGIKQAAVFLSIVLLTSPVYANPVLGNVAAGNVSIQQAPNSTVINQSSQQAILNPKNQLTFNNQREVLPLIVSTHLMDPPLSMGD